MSSDYQKSLTQSYIHFAMVMLEEREWENYGVSTWEDLIAYSKTIKPRKNDCCFALKHLVNEEAFNLIGELINPACFDL